MTPAGDESNSPGGGLPWAFVLDPAANAAALTGVQRQGLDAARRLVERAIAGSDRSTGKGPTASDTRHGGGRPDPRDPIGDLLGYWTELTAQVLAKLAEGPEPPPRDRTGRDGRIIVAIDGSGPPGTIRLRLDDGPGGRPHAVSEFRLSNPGERAVGPVDLHLDELHTPDGHKLTGGSVTFDPPVIHELAPGSGCRVGVTASPRRRPAPGNYRGIVQSAGAPGLVLVLEVEQPPPGR